MATVEEESLLCLHILNFSVILSGRVGANVDFFAAEIAYKR